MTLTLLLLASLGAVVLLFLSGVTIYVAGSYLLMLAHTEPRPLGQLVREAAAEFWWTVVTQPFLPLYYLIGRRLGGRRGKRPVVFVHGYAQNRVGFIGMARALARQGFGPLYGFNYPWFLSIASNGGRLGRFIEQVRRSSGASEVDLICHSMGGLVALEYLRQAGQAGAVPVRCCVTIATPHAGVLWPGPIPGACGPELRSEAEYLRELASAGLSIKVLSIFSTHDNVVHPPSSSMLQARGGRDLSIAGGGHMALLFHPRVLEQVGAFLEEGEQEKAAAGHPEVDTLEVDVPSLGASSEGAT
jgi:predicted alpha/beta hydrolase family esterase